MPKAFLSVLLMASSAFAVESFREQLERGHAFLRSGDVESALAEYRELQTEDPESDILYYSIGCAQYEKGLHEVDLQAPQDALASFDKAKVAFDQVLNAEDPEMRKKGAYNHANCVAQIAKQSAAAQEYDKTVEAFEQSVAEYEEFLRKHWDHEGARNNLDHVRYILKRMLQNPPPPPEQQQQGDKKEDQEGEQQASEQQEEGQNQQEQQQQGEEEQEQQEQQGEENQQEQQQSEEQASQEEAQEAQETDSQENIEALLQSLEDVDEREQREARQQRVPGRINRDWW